MFSSVIKNMGSTLGACGDVNRNVLAPPVRKAFEPLEFLMTCAPDIVIKVRMNVVWCLSGPHVRNLLCTNARYVLCLGVLWAQSGHSRVHSDASFDEHSADECR